MTAPTSWYLLALQTALNSALALGTPKLMLVSDAYTPDTDVDDRVNDISSYEAAGTGYTAGGLTLSGIATVVDVADDTVAIDADDVSGISVECCYAVLYVDTGTPSTSPVLTVTDLSEGAGTDVTVTGITWSTDGIGLITAA